MSEAFRWYPVFSITAASLANYSIRVWMCVRVHARVRSVSTKEEANRRFHQKHQNTKSVCVCMCAVHHVLTLMTEEISISIFLWSVYVFVRVHAACVCVVCLHVIA